MPHYNVFSHLGRVFSKAVAKIWQAYVFINTIISMFVLTNSILAMTLQQLEYVNALEKYGFFTSAAESCGVTQSTMSLMVKKLEEELDTTLFVRNIHPLRPTEAGKRVIEEARQILYHVDQIKELARTEKELVSGNLKVAMISTVAPVLMPGMFSYISGKYPDVKLQAYEMITPTILEQLKKTQIDMGIMSAPLNNTEFLEIPLYHEKFYAYVSTKEDYTGDVMDRKTLVEKRIWIMRDGVQQYDRSMLQPGESFSYDRMYEGGRVGTLIQITNEIGGYTIVPELHIPLIKEELKGRLKPIVNPEASRTLILVIRRDYVHERMMNVIIESLKTIIPKGFLESTIKTDYLRL